MDIRQRILIFLSVSVLLSSFLLAQDTLKIYCIDVNTGSSTLIVSPTNKYVLIDAGESSGNYGDTVFRFIRNLGITHLDYTIATHYHSDHIGGFEVVICSLSRGPGRNDSILNYCYDRGDTYTTSMFLDYKNAAGNKRTTIPLGCTLDLGSGVKMICVVKNGKVMNGDSVLPNSGENYRSIGFILKYGYFEFFIGGDLVGANVTDERDVETKVALVVRNVDVYVSNHHGSRNSNNATFLDSLRPEVAIFSQGVANDHPHQEAIDRLVARNTYLYQMNDNTQPGAGIIPDGCGRILNTTAAITVNNWIYIVNGDTYPIDGVRRDGTVLRVLYPPDTITEGTEFKPQAKIKNRGNTTESFNVKLKIGSAYTGTKTISNLAPNDSVVITFDPSWTAVKGNYTITCSTEVPRDSYPSNDRKLDTATVAFYDAQLKEIIIPTLNDTFYTTESIKPKVVIKDSSYFSNPSLVKVFCQISNSSFYLDSVQKTLNPSASDTILFKAKYLTSASPDIYRCSTWIRRNSDLISSNNSKARSITILNASTYPWTIQESMPAGLKKRKVSRGGALVAGIGNKIYALKGNNTKEFYVYFTDDDSWAIKESIAFDSTTSTTKKYPGKGASLAYDKFTNPDTIFAIKGNNTLEFWAYDVTNDTWAKKKPVPYILYPPRNTYKKLYGGSSITFLKQGQNQLIYLLKGNNTYEFYAYNCRADTWVKNLTTPPASDSFKPFKDGSCITTGRNDTIYALKGNPRYYNEFWAYDVTSNTWCRRESMPQRSKFKTGKTKVKDGAALCYSGDSLIYAIKGGNSQYFWVYNINRNCWTELDTMLQGLGRKKISSGGALAYINNKVYALKGNNTREFWCFDPENDFTFNVSQYQPKTEILVLSTVNNKTDIKFGSGMVKIYNATGRLIKTKLISNISIDEINQLSIGINKGVYFVRITSLNNKESLVRKLIKIE